MAAGLMLALALQWATQGALMGYHSAGYALHDTFVLMPFVAAIVMGVGLLAALGPARRGARGATHGSAARGVMRNDRWHRWLRLRRDTLEDLEDELRFPSDPQADNV